MPVGSEQHRATGGWPRWSAARRSRWRAAGILLGGPRPPTIRGVMALTGDAVAAQPAAPGLRAAAIVSARQRRLRPAATPYTHRGYCAGRPDLAQRRQAGTFSRRFTVATSTSNIRQVVVGAPSPGRRTAVLRRRPTAATQRPNVRVGQVQRADTLIRPAGEFTGGVPHASSPGCRAIITRSAGAASRRQAQLPVPPRGMAAWRPSRTVEFNVHGRSWQVAVVRASAQDHRASRRVRW